MFATQIAKYGRITDFSCANFVWDKIRKNHWTWPELDKEFRPLLNEILSKFRISSPKIKK